jgi:hypothetical protein
LSGGLYGTSTKVLKYPLNPQAFKGIEAFKMKHLEPEPQLLATPASSKTQPVKNSLKSTFAIAALALILGGGGVMTSLWNSSSSDDLSEITKTRLVNEFSAAVPIKLTAVTAHETGTALDSMSLEAGQRNLLMQTLSQDSSKNALAWIELWDFAAQDGDIVHISSAGFELDYPILNAPARIAIPIDAKAQVAISGMYDGGGGITLGIKSDSNGVSLPVILPGETLILPISF